LMKLYAAATGQKEADLQPLPFRYRDYTSWQRHFVQSPEGENHRQYWMQRLKGFSQETKFPARTAGASATDYPTLTAGLPTDPAESAVGMEKVIANACYDTLMEFARENGLTCPTILLGTLTLLIHRLTGQSDLTLTSTVSGRNSRYFGEMDISGIIGFFANSIFIRSTIDGEMSMIDHLHAVQRNFITDLAYDAYPFEKLLHELPEVSPGLMWDTGFFNYHNYTYYREEAYEITAGKEKGERVKVFPMIRAFGLIVTEYKNCLKMQLMFSRKAYEQADIEKIMEAYFHILDTLMQNNLKKEKV